VPLALGIARSSAVFRPEIRISASSTSITPATFESAVLLAADDASRRHALIPRNLTTCREGVIAAGGGWGNPAIYVSA